MNTIRAPVGANKSTNGSSLENADSSSLVVEYNLITESKQIAIKAFGHICCHDSIVSFITICFVSATVSCFLLLHILILNIYGQPVS